jgi:hypothetical protein
MRDRWEDLKALLRAEIAHNTHYSFERSVEHNQVNRVLSWMEQIENMPDIPEASQQEKDDAVKVMKQLELFFIELENERS